jgi:hypothetical protein
MISGCKYALMAQFPFGYICYVSGMYWEQRTGNEVLGYATYCNTDNPNLYFPPFPSFLFLLRHIRQSYASVRFDCQISSPQCRRASLKMTLTRQAG